MQVIHAVIPPVETSGQQRPENEHGQHAQAEQEQWMRAQVWNAWCGGAGWRPDWSGCITGCAPRLWVCLARSYRRGIWLLHVPALPFAHHLVIRKLRAATRSPLGDRMGCGRDN